jgi:hypothetical protein
MTGIRNQRTDTIPRKSLSSTTLSLSLECILIKTVQETAFSVVQESGM